MLDTVSKAHDHDEYLNAGVYLEGIEIYKKIIPNIANVWFTRLLEKTHKFV